MGSKVGLRMPRGLGRPRYNAKIRAFFEAYKGQAKLVGVEAARLAGYTNPRAAAQMLKARYTEDIERLETEFREQFKLGDEELDNIVAKIARNDEHKDQLKAVELAARMKGKLNDKVTVNIDRKTAMKELEEVLAAMQALAQNNSGDPQNNVIVVQNNRDEPRTTKRLAS